MKRFRMILLLCFLYPVRQYCQGQNFSFYSKHNTYTQLKQSLLKAVNFLPTNDNISLNNIKVSLEAYFNLYEFYAGLDSLKKHQGNTSSEYYVIMYYSMGDPTTNKLIIRNYDKNNQGNEVVYYLNPPSYSDTIIVNSYIHNQGDFNNVYNKMETVDSSFSNRILLVSIFNKGVFNTKVFNANDTTPENIEKIKSLLRNNW